MNPLKRLRLWYRRRVAIGNLKLEYIQAVEKIHKEMLRESLMVVEGQVVCSHCHANCGQCGVGQRPSLFQESLDKLRLQYHVRLANLEGNQNNESSFPNLRS